MTRTVSKHLASSIRAWILIIAGPPWGGVDVVTMPRTGPAYRRSHTSGTSTPESRMSQKVLILPVATLPSGKHRGRGRDLRLPTGVASRRGNDPDGEDESRRRENGGRGEPGQ